MLCPSAPPGRLPGGKRLRAWLSNGVRADSAVPRPKPPPREAVAFSQTTRGAYRREGEREERVEREKAIPRRVLGAHGVSEKLQPEARQSRGSLGGTSRAARRSNVGRARTGPRRESRARASLSDELISARVPSEGPPAPPCGLTKELSDPRCQNPHVPGPISLAAIRDAAARIGGKVHR